MGKSLEELDLVVEPVPRPKDLRTAQGRFALFIRDLRPLFRRIMVGLNLNGWEGIDFLELSDEQRTEFDEAFREYRRQVSATARALTGRKTLPTEALGDFFQVHHIPRKRRGGAPRKALKDRVDEQILSAVQREVARLFDGFELCRLRRRQGGFESDDEQIQAALVSRGFNNKDVVAITKARKPSSAAAQLIANRRNTPLRTIQAAMSRARRLRRSH